MRLPRRCKGGGKEVTNVWKLIALFGVIGFAILILLAANERDSMELVLTALPYISIFIMRIISQKSGINNGDLFCYMLFLGYVTVLNVIWCAVEMYSGVDIFKGLLPRLFVQYMLPSGIVQIIKPQINKHFNN
jgi:ABC-type Na+ efflux pump permease subunit